MSENGITLAEVVGAGLWVASVVEVFKFTYAAFNNTYQPFPMGSGTGDPGQAYDPAKPKGAAGDILGGMTPGSSVALGILEKSAPAAIVSTISTLYNHKQSVDPGAIRLTQWLAKNVPHDMVDKTDVWKAVIVYVERQWPGAIMTDFNKVRGPGGVTGLVDKVLGGLWNASPLADVFGKST